MAANSFTFFASYYEALRYLPDDGCGKMLKAMCEYAFSDNEPQFSDPTQQGYWTLIKPILNRSIERSKAGRQGGNNGLGISRNIGNSNASKKIANTEQNKSKTIQERNGIGVEKEMERNGNGNGVIDTKRAPVARFVPPSVEDVAAYCKERGNGIDAQHFVDFYAARGWKYGNTQIKDWQACVRTWEQRNGGSKVKANNSASLGVGEYIDNDGQRRYGTGNLPPVPMSAPPRPSSDTVFSRESNSWIPAGL